ncbi:hypothetical protein C8R44DRAFT_851000 [Mycena epipterygia]|nr:hypothetical protein C8R44DRAFT_851000 [Mycena epipterygia]
MTLHKFTFAIAPVPLPSASSNSTASLLLTSSKLSGFDKGAQISAVVKWAYCQIVASVRPMHGTPGLADDVDASVDRQQFASVCCHGQARRGASYVKSQATSSHIKMVYFFEPPLLVPPTSVDASFF